MSTISTTIQLNDATTSVLQGVVNALNLTISAFEQVQSAGNSAFNSEGIEAARNAVSSLGADLTHIQEGLNSDTAAQERFNSSATQTPALFSNITSQIKAMVGAYVGIQGIKAGISFFKESYEAANVQLEAETKLTTVMRQRMGATDSMVQSVKNLTAEQQKLGVVGDEVQMAGAQQLATFLNSDKALKNLIPAMNNLAVQQNGVDASSGNLVGIGNMMGKVMQGQTSALTRVGITFTEAQEKAIKYGNEEERAATLAQVITDNVGNMNQVIAQTPEGQVQQLKNSWGDMKEVIGAQLYPAIIKLVGVLTQQLPGTSSILEQIASAVSSVISGFADLLQILSDIGGILFGNDYSWIAPTLVAIGAAMGVVAIGLELIKIQAYLTSDAFAALLANPITLWAVGIAIVVAIIVYHLYKFVQSCGSVKVAWLTAVNSVLTWADNLKIGIYKAAYSVMGFLDQIGLKFATIGLNVQNYMSDMKVRVLMSLQNLVNDSVRTINDFINKINSVIGTNIKTISFVSTIGIDAAGEEALKSQERHARYNREAKLVADNQRQSENKLKQLEWDAKIKAATRIKGIDAAKAEAAKDKAAKDTSGVGIPPYDSSAADTAANTAATAANTGRSADSLEASEEDLQYITDMAAQQAINRFTTAEINFDFNNQSVINSNMDIDGVVNTMTEQLREAVYATAEEVHDV